MNDFNGLSSKIKNLSKTIDEQSIKNLRALASSVMTEIVYDSPVDTGRYRANNIVSINSPSPAAMDIVDKEGAKTIARNDAMLNTIKTANNTSVYIQNNVNYAGFVEDRYSVYNNAFKKLQNKLKTLKWVSKDG